VCQVDDSSTFWHNKSTRQRVNSPTSQQWSTCQQQSQIAEFLTVKVCLIHSMSRKAATDNTLQIIEVHPNWPLHADVFEHPHPRLASRCLIWSDIISVDTTTQCRVSLCGQPHYHYQPYHLTARFRSPLSHMVYDEPFPDKSRPMSC